MDRALVVIEPVEGIGWLVEEAGALALGVGASLVLLHITSEDEYEENRQTMEQIASHEYETYHREQAETGAKQFADDVGRQALREVTDEWESVGAIGKRDEQILATAEDLDCDHIFLIGRRRSPTGKAIFGDTAQQVILNFSGPVTVITDPAA